MARSEAFMVMVGRVLGKRAVGKAGGGRVTKFIADWNICYTKTWELMKIKQNGESWHGPLPECDNKIN